MKNEATKQAGGKKKYTVNDILSGIVTGAVRKYCLEHLDDKFTEKKLKKALYRSLALYAFPRKYTRGELNNKWCFVSLKMPIGETTGVKQLNAVKRSLDTIKSSPDETASCDSNISRYVLHLLRYCF